jgi:dsRNA-specific ribonuclease
MNDPVKPAGDASKTIIAAFYEERGFKALRSWIHDYYLPLIHAAGAGYQAYRRVSKTQVIPYICSSYFQTQIYNIRAKTCIP